MIAPSLTITELIKENALLRRRVGELERSEEELRRAEEALLQSEDKFRTLFETAGDAIFLMNKDIFVDCNRKTLEMFGCTRAEIIGKPPYLFSPEIQPDGRKSSDQAQKKIKAALRGQSQFFAWKHRRYDGTLFDAEVSLNSFRSAGGVYLQATVRDITARKQAEEALMASEAKYRNILESIEDGYFEVDLSGNFTFVSTAMCIILGYSREELSGANYRMVMDPENAGKVYRVFKEIYATGVPNKGFTWEIIQKSTARRHVEVSVSRIVDQEEKPTGFRGITRDTTEKRRSEEALRDSERKFRRLADNMHDMIAEVDTEGKRIYVSPSHRTVLGIEPSALLNESAFDHIHPDDLQWTLDNFNQGIATARPGLIRYRHLDSEGGYRWLESFGSPLYDSDQALIGGVIVSRDITEIKLAEDKLKNHMSFVETLLDTIPSPVFYKDTSGRYLGCNRAFEEFFGKSRSFIIGKTTFDIAPEEIAKKYAEKDWELLENPGTQTYEGEVAGPDGTIKDALINKATYTDVENNVIGLVGVLMDITAHKEAEKALRESESNYRRLFDSAPSVIYQVDFRTGKFLKANDMVCEYIGCDREEITSRSPYELLTDESRQYFLERLGKISSGKKVTETPEYEVIDKNGRRWWLQLNVKNLYDSEGLMGADVVAHDITARKEAEKALRESEEKYRQLVENINQGIFVVQDGMLKFVNPMCIKISGYSEQDLTTRPFIEFVHPDDRSMVLERYMKRMEGEKLPTRYEFRIVACEGIIKWVEIDSVRMQWNGKWAALGFLSDIKERKLLEAQLLQAQKMEAIGTLSGGIAHDFNNVLGAIIGNTEIALMELKSDTHLEKYLKRVFKASERAKDLVKQILIFSRQHEKDFQPLKMTPMIKEVMKLIRATLPSSIRIQQEIMAYPDTVLADPTQIHQVIMNLATNAAHAMHGGEGTLKISLTNLDVKPDDLATFPVPLPGPYLKLTFSDTGHGMEPSVQERIFDPFFTTKKQGEGTGLGLSVVHGIVKNHGGALTVKSEPGKGTSFHIYFPSLGEEGGAVAAETERSVPGGKERILFVDDEEELVRLAEDLLPRLGYKVIGMTDSMEALDLFKKRSDLFDIVITDQTMPDLTGKELAKKLLCLRPDIPIILCTGYLNQIASEGMKSLGIRESILKPVDMRKIAEAVRRVLDQRG